MPKQNYLISTKDCGKELPDFYDYAFVVNKVLEHLKGFLGDNIFMYTDEDSREEVWEVLSEDLVRGSDMVKCLGPVYDCMETRVIYSEHQGTDTSFKVKPNVDNTLYCYESFGVALLKTQVFHSHSYVYHTLIFAKDDEALLEFYKYVAKKQREYLAGYVTVFTDLSDEVQRKKERIENMVLREDVYMEENTKTQIYRSIDEFFSKSGEFFKTFNIPYKRGILLYGKPGNGKTTLVKSIAGSIDAPVVYWQITEHTSTYSISQVFETATNMAPMVLVIEDIDSMPECVRSVFLNTLDGAISREGIFLIGTTNYPEKIDTALINRAGRFDRAYEIKLPTLELRRKYLQKKNIENFLDIEQFEKLVKETEGFSFAQLNEIFTSAALQWHYEGSLDIFTILKEMKGDNNKGKKREWLNESRSLGFGR